MSSLLFLLPYLSPLCVPWLLMPLLFTFANSVARSLSRFVDVPRKNWPSPLGSYLLPFSGIVPGKVAISLHRKWNYFWFYGPPVGYSPFDLPRTLVVCVGRVMSSSISQSIRVWNSDWIDAFPARRRHRAGDHFSLAPMAPYLHLPAVAMLAPLRFHFKTVLEVTPRQIARPANSGTAVDSFLLHWTWQDCLTRKTHSGPLFSYSQANIYPYHWNDITHCIHWRWCQHSGPFWPHFDLIQQDTGANLHFFPYC